MPVETNKIITLPLFPQTKIGLPDSIKGYAIYEMLGSTERCVGSEEVLADVMSR